MDALVMAGGKGTRLKMGEKPMARLFGRPLLDYVISALVESGIGEISVAVTENVPATKSWAASRDLPVVDTPGQGFISDMVCAVRKAGIDKPVMVIMADLPLVTPELIDEIVKAYESRQEPALSVHTPLRLHSRLGRRPDSLFNYHGQLIVPAGVNILSGAEIEHEQEDYHLIIERIELAVNVNTAEDLKLCESIIQGDIS